MCLDDVDSNRQPDIIEAVAISVIADRFTARPSVYVCRVQELNQWVILYLRTHRRSRPGYHWLAGIVKAVTVRVVEYAFSRGPSIRVRRVQELNLWIGLQLGVHF